MSYFQVTDQSLLRQNSSPQLPSANGTAIRQCALQMSAMRRQEKVCHGFKESRNIRSGECIKIGLIIIDNLRCKRFAFIAALKF